MKFRVLTESNNKYSINWIKELLRIAIYRMYSQLSLASIMYNHYLNDLDEDDWEDILYFLNILKFPLTVYRGLKITNDLLKINIDKYNIGVNWTFDKRIFNLSNSAFKNSNVILSGVVTDSQIDWPETIMNYIHYTLRLNYGMASEKEITLKKGEIPDNINIEKRFLEAYLDKEQKFWNYETGNISGDDIFSTKKTGFSYWDLVLTDPEYMKYKGYSGVIIDMTPELYFEACAKIFGTTPEALKRHIERDQDILKDLYTVINKYKQKFPLTYLNVKDKTQEGRHRMYVAGELFGWNHKFPVLIIQDVNNPRFKK